MLKMCTLMTDVGLGFLAAPVESSALSPLGGANYSSTP